MSRFLGNCLRICDSIYNNPAFSQTRRKEYYSERWISFTLWIVAISAYIFIENPIYALSLSILINLFAFYPTFRKTYYKPHEETLLAYVLAGSRSAISIPAMGNFSILTLTAPTFFVIVNVIFVTMVIIRKRQLQ